MLDLKDWKFYFCASLDSLAWGFLAVGCTFLMYISAVDGTVKNINTDDYVFFTEEPYYFILMTVIHLLFFLISSCIFIASLNDIATFSNKLYGVGYLRKYRAYQIKRIGISKIHVLLIALLLLIAIYFYFFGVPNVA